MMIFAAATLAIAALGATADDHAETPDDRGLSTLSSGTYVMDKTHGYIFMTYSHLGYSRPTIRFDDVDAVVEFNADNITASTLMVDIDPATIDSGIEKFDQHLVGADMFDVDNHGEIKFVSTGIMMQTDYSGLLMGDLTIKGITKPVTLNVVLNRAAPHPFKGAEAFGVSATGMVKRTDFDLGYAAPAVSDEVQLRIEAEFLKK